MAKNYSNFTKEELLELVVKQDNELAKKKYGLVWDSEKEPEKVVLDCENNIPLLKRVKDKEIRTDESDDNILIEGDNYHALTCLNYTHKEKIDVIYIDPPYNTGNKDFVYNDRYIDQEDGYRHSKWLNFMEKRLKLASNLLKKTGVIFISIDDNEMAQLKLLCDSIFGMENCIACLPTIMNLKGNNDQFGFSGTHEYTFVYAKNILKAKLNEFKLNEEELSKWIEDEIGYFKKGSGLLATSFGKTRKERPYMYFPLLVKNNKLFLIKRNEWKNIYDSEKKIFNDNYLEKLKNKYINQDYDFILPIDKNGNLLRWTWGYDGKFQTHIKDIIINKTKTGYSFSKKQRPAIGNLPSKKPKSLFYKPEYSSSNGTALLKEIFNKKSFDSPKPLQLIKDIIILSSQKNSIILDFMAGSGTTGQAVLELNKEDNGNRKFILCTNNELNGIGSDLAKKNSNKNKEQFGICQRVTFPRLEKVTKGYKKNGDGEFIEGLNGNLQYFKTDLIPVVENIEKLLTQEKLELTKKAGQMIAISENTFEEIETNEWYQIFENKDKSKKTAIYFREDLDELQNLIEKLSNKKTTLYLFSYEKEIRENIFELPENILLEAIPVPILKIYEDINLTLKKI